MRYGIYHITNLRNKYGNSKDKKNNLYEINISSFYFKVLIIS